MDMNFSVFQEPRGVMRIIQFIFSICAFATTVNFSGYVEFHSIKPFKYWYSYPFNLHLDQELDLSVQNTTCHPRVSMYGDFSSDAKFFVATGVIAMLYTLIIAFVYVKFDQLYKSNTQIPLIDFLLSVFIAVLWLSSSASWANSLNGLKDITDTKYIAWNNAPTNCIYPISNSNFSTLNISVILGFLNFFLWAADLWFLYKETSWFQNAQIAGPDVIKIHVFVASALAGVLLIIMNSTMEFISNLLKKYYSDSSKSSTKADEEIVLPDVIHAAQLSNKVMNMSLSEIIEKNDDSSVCLDVFLPAEVPSRYQENLPTPPGITIKGGFSYKDLKVQLLNNTKMDDLNEDKMVLQQEINELKLELNQIQQERANNQVQLHQKDEIILKLQGQVQKKDNQYKQEIRQLQEKLHFVSEFDNNGEIDALKEENLKLKCTEKDLKERIFKMTEDIDGFRKVMKDYDDTLSSKVTDWEKLQVEYEIVKQHLAALEMAFSDVHTKYERAKGVIAGYKSNEEMLVESLSKSNEIAQKYEERYESLKTHAKAQLDKANQEILVTKDKHHVEMCKLTTIIKRLEIKCASIQQALDQKSKECFALSALCDELTGSTPKIA